MTKAFRTLLLEAIREFSTRGYVSESDLQQWTARLHAMIESELPTDEESREILAGILGSVYAREYRSGIARRVPGVSRYTLDRVAPHLRAELDKRIFASADLIRIRKKETVEKTLARFSGWASSVPPTGTFDFSPRALSKQITKDLVSFKFERRRVAIDQAAKLSSNVASVVAMNNGAIAAIWHDVGKDFHAYDARPAHLKRDGKLFLVRDSWAITEGLIRRGATQYTDEIEQPAEFVYCQCWYEYVVHIQDLPETMLTAKGRAYIRPAVAS
jgi:hypothetical protein